MRQILFSLMLLSVVLSGCFLMAEEEVNVTENETPPPPPPTPVPSFTITSPSNGEVVIVQDETGDATLVMSTQNLLLRAPGGAKKVGEGHFKFTVDGTSAGTGNSKIHVLSGLSLGSHTVEVELVHNDGTSYVPRIMRTLSFTVEQAVPEVYEPENYEVSIRDFEYNPASITVKQTDTITWTNDGAFPRSATCFIDGKQIFDTGVLGPGQSKTITMDSLGTCEYYATTHRAMTGTVTVESNE